jgi:uncharacterized membrane protein YccC
MKRSPLHGMLCRQSPHLFSATRGTAAALTALAAAELLGLTCPYWAAMTALIVIQPTRGLLLEKSFYRLIGTVVGSSAGLLLLLGTRSPILLTAALCLWIALCVGIGNLLYGLRSYAALMAGCTCVVIAMSGYQSPSHLYDIAFGRVACIIVGIIFATLVTALFTPRQSRSELRDRLDRVTADCLAWLAALLRQGRAAGQIATERDILIEIAEIESLLDAAGAGSFRFKQQARHLRSLISSLLSLLAVGRLAGAQLSRHPEAEGDGGQWRDLLARQLKELADTMAGSATACPGTRLSELAAGTKHRLPLLGEALEELANSQQQVFMQCGALAEVLEKQPASPFHQHRDWREACRAAFRGALTIGAIGVTWSLTGWAQGPLTLMATSIMITIFSTKEHPAAFVGNIFVGAATGSAVAVFCRLVLLHGVSDPLLTGAIIAPFLLAGVFAMPQRVTATGATDATLFFIFTVQPGVPVRIMPYDLMLGAIAMILGVVSAWIAYRFVVPINPALRLNSLLSAIMGDLHLLASGKFPRSAWKLQARMQHRVIRLVIIAARHDADHLTLVEGGITAMAIAKSIGQLRELIQKGELSCEKAALIQKTLLSLESLRLQPGDAVHVLKSAGDRLYDLLDAGFGKESSAPSPSFS